MEAVTYSAPAKVILCGEHFVVYGGKAVACAIPKRAYATVSSRSDGLLMIESRDAKISATWNGDRVVKSSDQRTPLRLRPLKLMIDQISEKYGAKGFNITIQSQIPRGMGLGSSASVSLATASACLAVLGHEPSTNELLDIASIAESEIHYRSSGVDLAATLTGGVISYIRGMTPRRIPTQGMFDIILIKAEKARKTGTIVRQVSILREQFINIFERLKTVNDEVATEMEIALQNMRFERIGSLFTVQHNLLKTIGVSNRSLDEAVESALDAGALGAKLTGAGGGGFVIAIAHQNKSKDVVKALSNKYAAEVVKVPQEGLRRER
ncbi:MAG: mevalonate kinase [Nitrososphaerota archaeon]